VPWHLTTVEFVRECKARMTPDGAYIANTIDLFQTGGFIAAMHATLRSVFRNVDVIGAERRDDFPMNFVFVASDAPLDLSNLTRVDPASGLDLSVVPYSRADFDDLERRTGAKPLTDDYAPVERLLAPVVEASPPR